MNADGWLKDTRASYDTVAVSYADQVRDALDGALYLRAVLALFADMVRTGGGPVADVGCGPGHITARLHELGVDAFGIDLSPAMIGVAQRDHPGLRFEVGSMTAASLEPLPTLQRRKALPLLCPVALEQGSDLLVIGVAVQLV